MQYKYIIEMVKVVTLYIYISIVVAIDEAKDFSCFHFSMKNIEQVRILFRGFPGIHKQKAEEESFI